MTRTAKLTYAILAVATAVAAGLMLGQYGMIPGFDFGCGQYYYTDIPNWERYFSVRGIVDSCPRWVYYLLFAAWGVLMYKLWTWLDRYASTTKPSPYREPSSAAASPSISPPTAFPVFLAPRAARALVVGTGRVATHKAETLRAYGFAVDLCEPATFDATTVATYTLVIAATSDVPFNRRVSEACRAARVLVNVVDDPELCSFYFSAVERKGPFTVAVSSNGTCPVAAQVLRDRIRPLLTDDLIATTERLARDRADWKKNYPDSKSRAAAMRKEFAHL